MNNLFIELIDLLNKEFKKFNLDEVVQLNLSKIPEFDMQINNLVKYNKSENFNILQKNLIEIINSTNFFQKVEENELGFLNLVFNHNVLIKHITNKKSNFLNENRLKELSILINRTNQQLNDEDRKKRVLFNPRINQIGAIK